MKKISVFSFYKETPEVVDILEELGLVHIILEKKHDELNNDELETKKKRISRAIEEIKKHGSLPLEADADPISIGELLDDFEKKRSQLEKSRSRIEFLRKEKIHSEPWGLFNLERLEILKNRGINVRFFEAQRRAFEKHDFSGFVCEVIHRTGDKIYFIIIDYNNEPVTVPFDQSDSPQPLDQLQDELTETVALHDSQLRDLRQYGRYLHSLESEYSIVYHAMTCQRVSHEFTKNGNEKVDRVTGWLPLKNLQEITNKLDERGLGYQISDPKPGDSIPVVLRNGPYAGIFETITRVFQLPGYYELDLTPVIAVFYPIFFAYCLGDAGYGLVVVIAALAGWFTFLKKSRNIALLGLILGTLTTLMGIVKSGSIFGLPLVSTSGHPLLNYLSQFVLIPDDQSFVFNAFNVALMLGVVQIFAGIISAILNKILYHSFKESLSLFGKMFIIIAVIILFLAKMQDVEVLQPYITDATVLLYIGIGMVLLFHDLNVSVIPRVSSGILPLFFIFTGILGDTLSYVRLFALGVASSVLGLVVNQIGMQIMGDSFIGIIIGIIFLLFGHTLNLALAILGAFVHPLRLTFVEFYNNAEFKGGGIEYKPFRKLNSELNIE
ncbi:MAG: V-type ATP synthase subunit I [Bacteroidetes bacterium]|nr:V-type ATP synthase subunit I [Bacteroidota bacterium]